MRMCMHAYSPPMCMHAYSPPVLVSPFSSCTCKPNLTAIRHNPIRDKPCNFCIRMCLFFYSYAIAAIIMK